MIKYPDQSKTSKKRRKNGSFKPRWKPDQIYYFKSGKYIGRSMAEIMFEDYRYLQAEFKLIINKQFNLSPVKQLKMQLSDYFDLSRTVRENKSELHKNLEFYLEMGEKGIPNKSGKIICPYCDKEPVRYFALVDHHSYGFVINPKYVSCKNKTCTDRLKTLVYSDCHKLFKNKTFKFSVFGEPSIYLTQEHYSTVHKQKVVELFTKVFNLPKPINPQVAYNFFISS